MKIIIKGKLGSGRGLLADKIMIYLESIGIKSYHSHDKESEYTIVIEENIVEKLRKLI